MKHNDKDLEKIYQEIFEDALDYMKDHEIQAVAATYMAIAMRLYKTNLTNDAFIKMIRTVMETEVEPYEPKKVLH
jgi:glutamate dehydrogenase/leucine dehydrogenase